MKKVKTAATYALEWLQAANPGKSDEPYIKPSSLARGCMLYVAFELQGKAKPVLDARVGRILSVGTDSHRRLQRGLARACLAQEVFFEVEEYRIHGFCDGILYIPAGRATDQAAGFWALEFKTTAGSEFDKLKAAKMAKEEHIRQAQIYLWGIEEYYQGAVPLQGAIIYYENRDTLEHLAYEVYLDREMMAGLLGRVKTMLAGLATDRLPEEDVPPPEHWAHTYCPYLEICQPGQKAIEWQKAQPKELPDSVLADIIARRIVAKKGAEKMTTSKKKGQRSLADLAEEMKWG